MSELAPALEQEEWRCWESGEWRHLPYVVLRELTRQQLDATDAEIAQAHLDICPECRKEAADLVTLHQSLLRAKPAPPRQASRSWLWMPLVGSAIGAAATLLFLAPRALQRSPDQERLARIEAALAEREGPSIPTPAPSASPIPKIAFTPTPPPTRPTPDPEIAKLQLKVARLEKAIRQRPTSISAPSHVPVQVALAVPDLRDLSGGSRRTLDGAPFALTFPVGVVVATGSPKLVWESCSGATVYRVLIARLGETDPIASVEVAAPETAWQAPSLPRGVPLAWEVHALDSEGKELGDAPMGRFQCVTKAQEKALMQVNSPLKKARLQIEAGLFAEARQTLDSLSDSREKHALLRALRRGEDL